jgi:hypothetical protein
MERNKMKFAHIFITSLLVVITLHSTPSKADWQDLLSGFEIVESRTFIDVFTRFYYVDVEIENSGLSVLDGPLRLLIDNASISIVGADKSVNEQTLVMLAGSGTDPDGSVASYRWTQLVGPSVTLANPNDASTSFDSPAATSALTLMFQLTVTDDEGATTSDSVVITGNPLPTQTLTVTGENDGNNFVMPWHDVGADSYRVLFWDNDGNVYGPTTASLSLSIASAIRRLSGSLVVEAYDARGNSVFSSPINVEAL